MCATFLPQTGQWDVNSILILWHWGTSVIEGRCWYSGLASLAATQTGVAVSVTRAWKEGLFGNQPGQDLAYFRA